jgi:acyl-CoA thioesterase
MLEALGFLGTAEVDRDAGRVTLRFRAEIRHCNNAGMVQGGFVTAWLDCAMSSAVFVKRGSGTTLASLEIKTAYYAPILPGAVVSVEGWIERMGARTAFLEGRVVDGAGNVLAKTTSTATVRSPARASAAEPATGGAAPAASADSSWPESSPR